MACDSGNSRSSPELDVTDQPESIKAQNVVESPTASIPTEVPEVTMPPEEACEQGGNVRQCVEAHGFTGSVLVAKNWEVVFEDGFGLADNNTGRLNTPDTVFRIGSITKQFTAALVLSLQEDGLLSVDDSIDQYFPDFHDGDNITVHHLLTHTSGIWNYTDTPDLMALLQNPESGSEHVYSLFSERRPIFPAGATFMYSNSGYHLLGLIIEQVAGRPYEQLVQERIFQPLGMQSSGFGDDDFSEPDVALAYSDELGQLRYINHNVPFAAGALVSNVKDILKWDKALFEGELLEPDSFTRMFTAGLGAYGYGWYIGDSYVHAGGISGFSAINSYWADDGIVIVIMSNKPASPQAVESVSNDLYRMISTSGGPGGT